MNEIIKDEKDQKEAEPIRATLDRFHEIEIEKVFDAITQVNSLRVQCGIFFATVNLGAMAVAFNTKNAGIIFLASLLIPVFMLIDLRGYRALSVWYVRAIQLENRFASDKGSTFLTCLVHHYEDFRRIAEIPTRKERIAEVKKFAGWISKGFGQLLPVLGFIAENVLGLLVWQLSGWTLF